MKVEAKLSRRTTGLRKGKEKSMVGSRVLEPHTLTPKRLCSMAPWAKNRHNEDWGQKIGPQNQRARKTFHLINTSTEQTVASPTPWKRPVLELLHRWGPETTPLLPCSANRNAHWCNVTLTRRMRTQLSSFSEPPCLYLLRHSTSFPFILVTYGWCRLY